MKRLTSILVLAGLAVTGCGGSDSDPATQSPAPPTTMVASAVAADDPCGLLSAEDLNQVLGTQYETGERKSDDARQIVTCTYTMTEDVAGSELPVSITDVGVSQIDGGESFDTNRDLAPAYFGADPTSIEVAGAQKAYVVINEQTQSPVLGMLVGDRFVLIQIGVEGSTTDQAQALAATAASRMG